MDDQPMTLTEFIEKLGIHFAAEHAPINPNTDWWETLSDVKWNRTARHYHCVFTRIGFRELHTPFSMGSGLNRKPTAEDVLDCLASDAAGYENARDFKDWCSEYGYTLDSKSERKRAKKLYEAVKRASIELYNFIADDEMYDQLLYEVERL